MCIFFYKILLFIICKKSFVRIISISLYWSIPTKTGCYQCIYYLQEDKLLSRITRKSIRRSDGVQETTPNTKNTKKSPLAVTESDTLKDIDIQKDSGLISTQGNNEMKEVHIKMLEWESDRGSNKFCHQHQIRDMPITQLRVKLILTRVTFHWFWEYFFTHRFLSNFLIKCINFF